MDAGQKAIEFLDSLCTLRELNASARSGFEGVDNLTVTKDYDGQGTDRYLWEDGAGNEANLLLNFQGDPSDAVLYVYDHESEFNTYSLDVEESPFDSAPEPYNQLKEDKKLFWTWEKNAKRVEATAVAWWDGDGWQLSAETVEAMDDAGEDGGLSYCLAWLVDL